MEIELKAIITKEKHNELLELFKRMPEYSYVSRSDTYYSKDEKGPHPFTVRKRTEINSDTKKMKTFFTIKEKHVDENGLESNIEKESMVDNFEGISAFLTHEGYKPNFTKKKISAGYYNGYYHVELVSVSTDKHEPIYAIEIEIVVSDECTTEADKQTHYNNEILILEANGISKDAIEKRSWRELLGE